MANIVMIVSGIGLVISLVLINIDSINYEIPGTILFVSFAAFMLARAKDYFNRGLNFYGYCYLVSGIFIVLTGIYFAFVFLIF